MTPVITLLLLVVAAALEVGGDAIVRAGLKNTTGLAQAGLLALGAGVLFAYGIFVNSAPLDFGRLLGVYVALFFIVAQIVNLLAFGVRPSASIVAGGALIVAGGALITLWRA